LVVWTEEDQSVYPTGVPRPNISNLNPIAGVDTNNQVTVGLGDGGQATLYNNANSLNAIVDVVGYYTTWGFDTWDGDGRGEVDDADCRGGLLGSHARGWVCANRGGT
jgi:hypothetical protein